MNLQKHYVSPSHKIGFSGKNVISDNLKISSKKLDQKLSRIPTYVLHREAKRPAVRNSFYIYNKRELLQADLIDMQKRSQFNSGVRYILAVCDTFTRKCWVKPLKDKKAPTVLLAFKQIYKQTGKFRRLLSDQGSEFVSGVFKAFLLKEGIKYTRGNPHAPHIERLNRTLQSKIFKYMTENETNTWLPCLDPVVKGYNNRRHRILKMSPNEAEVPKNKDKVISNLTLYYEKSLSKRKDPKFSVGDVVSLQKEKGVFAKGYTQVFTDELYKITEVHSNLPIPMYSLETLDGTEKVIGRFYENEMQKANYDVFKIEKILDKRVRDGLEEFFVKWKGWPSSYNQWIPAANVTRVYNNE